MNNKLLEQLANKLGTSVQYLWDTLVHQAFINGIINLIFYAIVIIAAVILYKYHKKFSKENERGYTPYYQEEYLVPVMVSIAIIVMTLMIVGLTIIGDTINSFFNPEYWALSEVLHAIGGH